MIADSLVIDSLLPEGCLVLDFELGAGVRCAHHVLRANVLNQSSAYVTENAELRSRANGVGD